MSTTDPKESTTLIGTTSGQSKAFSHRSRVPRRMSYLGLHRNPRILIGPDASTASRAVETQTIVKELFPDQFPPTIRATRAANDAALVESWLGTFDPLDSAGTLILYRRVQGRFFEWIRERGLTLTTLKLEDLSLWKSQLKGATATRATAMSVIKSLIGYAHRSGYIPLNVAAAVRSSKVAADPNARNLTESDIEAMISAARRALAREESRVRPRPRSLKTARLRLHLTLWAYYSGCRVSEIANARWEDVHARPDGDYNLSILGKGRRRRTVSMPRKVVEEITDGNASSCTGPIFQVGTRRLQTSIKDLARQAGLSASVSAHWLRHGHASHAIDQGAPLHVVQESLGHASLATTGRYLHRTKAGAGKYLVAL